VCVAPTAEEAEADLTAGFATRGVDLSALSDADRAAFTAMVIAGDPDTVGERLADDLTTGVDGFTLNAPLNGHIEGRVELLGQVASSLGWPPRPAPRPTKKPRTCRGIGPEMAAFLDRFAVLGSRFGGIWG